jgi:hypothetical protein
MGFMSCGVLDCWLGLAELVIQNLYIFLPLCIYNYLLGFAAGICSYFFIRYVHTYYTLSTIFQVSIVSRV